MFDKIYSALTVTLPTLTLYVPCHPTFRSDYFPNHIKLLVLLMETYCVLCEVGPEVM